MRDIKAIIEGIVSQGRQVGSGGAAFRSASSSGSSGKHDHGVDIGAHRNQAHELRAKDAAADRAKAREKEVARRNREAEKRSKEVSGMANEENVDEARKPGRSLMDDPRVKRALMVHNVLQGKTAKPDSEKKETPVKKESVSEGTYSKHDTDHLKQMHARDSGVISRYKGKMGSGISDVIDREHNVRKELSKRGHKVDRPKHSLVIEDKMSAGTEARVKIKNVARPDDPAPTSDKSTLSKTGQIKTKIIDEEKPLMSDRNFGLPAGLIAAARQIIEKKDDVKLSGGKTQVELEPETDDKVDESDSKKKHTVPKTDKEKKLAALATPKDKITHKDVLVGRGVVKEDEDDDFEQIDERADEHGYSLHKTAHKRVRGVTGGFDEPVAATKITYTVKQHGKKVGEIHKHKDSYEPTAAYSGHLHGKEIPFNRTKGHGVHALMKDIVGSKWHAKHAPKVAKEEVEQVDETAKGGYGVGWMLKADPKLGDKVKQNVAAHKAKVAAMGKPSAGVSVKKEEVEQVDEVSKATLGSYVKKASDDATKHSYMAAKTGNLDTAAKASKRIRGIAKATDKLAKESFSQEELDRLEEIAKKFD